jgi:hypothetical protein
MGQYGIVYKTVVKNDPLKAYACKQMSIRELNDRGCLGDLYSEINNLRKVNHPNIIKLVEEKR